MVDVGCLMVLIGEVHRLASKHELSKKNVQHRCHQEIFDSAWQAALCCWSITWRRFVNFKSIPDSKTVCLLALGPSIWSPSNASPHHIMCIGIGTIWQVKTDGENSPTCTIHGNPGSTEKSTSQHLLSKSKRDPVLSTSYLCNSMYCVQMSKFKIADALRQFVQGILKSSEIKTYTPSFTSHIYVKKKRKLCLALGRWSTNLLASFHAVNVNNHPTGGCFGCAVWTETEWVTHQVPSETSLPRVGWLSCQSCRKKQVLLICLQWDNTDHWIYLLTLAKDSGFFLVYIHIYVYTVYYIQCILRECWLTAWWLINRLTETDRKMEI